VIVTDGRHLAIAHAMDCFSSGSEARVLVEEYLQGPEVSLFAVTDGTVVLPLLPAQDFKRVGDDDTGSNTGGMGAYAPLPWLPDGFVDEVHRTVLQPVVDEMRRRGTPFTGLLYAGLIVTRDGVRVIEFNARFGDPETQSVLALLETPLRTLLLAAATGELARVGPLQWRAGSSVTVVIASAGYPDRPRSGDSIHIAADVEKDGSGAPGDVLHSGTTLDGEAGAESGHVLHAGTALDASGQLVTSGGRVLSVVGLGSTLEQARDNAYRLVDGVDIAGAHHRRDIALKAVEGRISLP
jgi:phosphoribosylamine---glycine ligase